MNSQQTNIYPAGTALALSEGEHSDFGYIGHIVTLKKVDLPALVDEFKAGYVGKDKWDTPRPSGFVGWLVANGHAFPADVQEVHLGSYGSLRL